MPSFHIENFGCRAARADGEAIGSRLLASGQQCVQQLPEADVVVVNTCSVTAEADRQARAFIRRASRLNPSAKIVVTGCYAQRAPAELAAMTGVAAVVGNSHKALAPEIISRLMGNTEPTNAPAARFQGTSLLAPQTLSFEYRALAPEEDPSSHVDGVERTRPQMQSIVTVASLLAAPASIHRDDSFAHSFIEDAQLTPGAQTRPNLKIQEGCGNRCTFCVIPFTRGPSRSLAFESVIRQVEGFVALGGNELVLSGINLGRWGRDLNDPESFGLESWPPTLAPERRRKDGATIEGGATRLAALVRQILTRTGLPRLRLSSIEPMDWDGELIALMVEFAGPQSANPRLARHAHLPLQSGSDAVLRRMHRRYRPWHYAGKAAELVRAAGPKLTLGADVMVGFPGESDTEFEETVAFIRALPFGYLHLFPFSPRPGTRGWALHAASPVASGVVGERMNVLRSLAREKSLAHRARMIGLELPAITLHTPAALAARGFTEALTDNFLPAELEGAFAANQLLSIVVTGLTPEGALAARAARLAEFAPDLTETCALNFC